MKKIIRWFFVIGSFVFLYWYIPEAIKDNKVTLIEIGIILINSLCLMVNLTSILEEKFKPTKIE